MNKKIFARVILASLILVGICPFLYKVFIEPFIELGTKYGVLGVLAWLSSLIVFGLIIWIVYKIVTWCLKNI